MGAAADIFLRSSASAAL